MGLSDGGGVGLDERGVQIARWTRECVYGRVDSLGTLHKNFKIKNSLRTMKLSPQNSFETSRILGLSRYNP